MRNISLVVIGLSLIVLSLAGCAEHSRPIVVQGAMDLEVTSLAGRLENSHREEVGGWTFWRGTIDGCPVIVSKTMKGMSNAAAATAIAIEHYRPAAILNQGTAGGHDPSLHVYDIVLGKDSVNLGAFKSAYREPGQGSDFRSWNPMDLLASEGSAGQDPKARVMRRFPGDGQLLAVAASVKQLYQRGKVVEGTIGSSDMWNSELDRIQRYHDQYGTSVEEMETASAAQIAGVSQVPFLGIRVLSNNITNAGAWDPETGEACQEYVYAVVKALAAAQRKR